MKVTIVNKYYDRVYGCFVRDLVIETTNFKKTYVIGGWAWKHLIPAGAMEILRIAQENGVKIEITRTRL